MLSAAIQLCAGPDRDANLAAAIGAVREAAAGGAKLVVLPEKWLALGNAATIGAAAEKIGGPLTDQLGHAGRRARHRPRRRVVSETGSDDDPRLFNASLHFRPDGTLAAAYRKVHLFDADIAGRRYRESDAEQAGQAPVVSALNGGELVAGLAICFDLRFPEYFTALGAGGANVISLPAAFTERTTRDHWEVLVRARAIEIGAYVIAANQCGEHGDGSRTGGQSMIVSPWGEVLAQAGGELAEIIYAPLDPAAIAHAREALPVLALRRPDVYARGASTVGLAS